MKEISGRKGYYVTESGEVWSDKRGNLREMSQHTHKKGYKVVTLWGPKKNYFVHRLVLAAYKDKVEGKDFCNHKDGDKTNNHKSNLEWCTVAENNLHAIEVLGCKPLCQYSGREHNRAMRYTVTDPKGTRSYETWLETIRLSGYSEHAIKTSLKYGSKLKVDYIWTKERIHMQRRPKGGDKDRIQ